MRMALLTAAVAAAATAPAALLAQRASAPAPAAGTALTLFAGAGGVRALAHPGLDRATGAAVVGGAELARPALAGPLGRLALRLEAGLARQDFSGVGSVVGGDVETAHAALALRVGLGRRDASARLAPYALAGAVVARPSTRMVLSEDSRSTPGARFEQVTHETVPGVLLGAGIAWRAPQVALRAEARWISIATAEHRTSSIPLLLSIAIPLGR